MHVCSVCLHGYRLIPFLFPFHHSNNWEKVMNRVESFASFYDWGFSKFGQSCGPGKHTNLTSTALLILYRKCSEVVWRFEFIQSDDWVFVEDEWLPWGTLGTFNRNWPPTVQQHTPRVWTISDLSGSTHFFSPSSFLLSILIHLAVDCFHTLLIG